MCVYGYVCVNFVQCMHVCTFMHAYYFVHAYIIIIIIIQALKAPKIAEVSRDGRIKTFKNKSARDNNGQKLHPS